MGKAVLSSKALKVGRFEQTVLFQGDGYTNKSEGEAITVKVKR